MRKFTDRSFYELGIFIFSIYLTKVSSAPSVSTKNIIHIMQQDAKLCNMPKFLYENNITGECQNETYPEGDLTPTDKNKSTFLCLAFYDTWYKYCQTDQKLFSNETTFTSYIQEFFPGDEESDKITFCEKVKGINFSYEKLKPLLSHVNFSIPVVCYTSCFDIKAEFIPLCGILAWSANIDKINQIKKDQETNNHNTVAPVKAIAKPAVSAPLHKQVQGSANSKGQAVKGAKDANNDVKVDTAFTENINKNDKDSHMIIKNTTKAKPMKDTDDKNKSLHVKLNSDTDQQSNVVNNNNLEPSNPQKAKDETESETLQRPLNDELKSIVQSKDANTNSNIEDTEIKMNEKDVNEDVNVNTISENTEDHENLANQEKWSHVDEDKFSNVDLVQSVPEPSERNNFMSHYHSIRTDEESHFFTYFTIVSLVSIAAYIGYHNKQKILAIVLEGRRSRTSRGRRRPSTANYRKLDCTLEEAVTSQCNANVTHVIY